jgi:uncharacterized membrane protein YgdD (TMEM256/DUF423 family)
MNKTFIGTAALLGALSVALGAFAAHVLRAASLSADAVQVFETGVRYQFYHALALLVIGLFADKFSSNRLRWAGNCWIAGIILFSGSLYVLTIQKLSDHYAAINMVGILTPIGGLLLIAGWLLLFFSIKK